MRVSITCDGADTTSRRLRNMGTRALDQSRTMGAAARDTAHTINDVPVATGRLARSVRNGGRATRSGFEVTSDVPYAPFVFGGTRHMPARPPSIPRDVGVQTARMVSADLQRVTL
jgi:hypothetical protein